MRFDPQQPSIEALAKDIAEYFAGERKALSRIELVTLIVADARHTKLWPDASYERWNIAIDIAAELGLLRVDGAMVRHIEAAAEEPKPNQLDLF